jgi:hypothetical protein
MSYLNPGYLPVNSCSVFTVTPMLLEASDMAMIWSAGQVIP